MGANSRSPGMGGRTADAGKQAMMEAMMRKEREEQVTNAQRSPLNAELNADFRSDLERKQAMMEAMMRKEREEQVTNGFNMPAKGGISMGPGRSTRYTDEDAQEIMQRAQMAARLQRQVR